MSENTFSYISTNWSNTNNWSAGHVPNTGSDVDFSAGTYTSTDELGATTINSLNVNVATVTLDIETDLTVANAFDNIGTVDIDYGADLSVGTLDSNSGTIDVNSGTLTINNFNSNIGNITAQSGGLVDLAGTGTGNFTLSGGTLEVAGNFNNGGTITMSGGTVWVAGQLGNSAYDLNGGGNSIYFDSLQSTTSNAILAASAGDQIAIKGVTSLSSYSYSGTTLTLSTNLGTFTFTDITLAPGATAQPAFGTETFQGNEYGYIELACFAAGTCIDTPDGPVPVEALREGQGVLTADGTVRPVRWLGTRRLDLARHPAPALAQPIRIMADAIAPGVPRCDLLVSPDHALFLDGGLIPARLLVNGASIRQEHRCRSITYYHVELDSHDLLLAEGLAAESYLDTGNRGVFENAGQPLTLHPDMSQANDQRRREAGSCAPFVDQPAPVHAVWQRIAARAGALGMALPDIATTEDADVCLELNGRRLRPVALRDGGCTFMLPRTGGRVRLISRASAPCALRPWVEDRRSLGLMVQRLTLRRDGGTQAIALDHPDIGKGWWAVERVAGAMWRWTAGAAELPLEPGGPALLDVEFAALPAYCLPLAEAAIAA